MQLQRPETAENSGAVDRPRMDVPILSEWRPSTLDGPTTTEKEGSQTRSIMVGAHPVALMRHISLVKGARIPFIGLCTG